MGYNWEDWWSEVKSFACTLRQVAIMDIYKNLYQEYYEEGLSPAEAYDAEW